MGPLTILHGMALATIAGPMPIVTAAPLAVDASIATYNLPQTHVGIRILTGVRSMESASLPNTLPAVPVNDAPELPKIAFRDGGVMEIGRGGLKFGWHF